METQTDFKAKAQSMVAEMGKGNIEIGKDSALSICGSYIADAHEMRYQYPEFAQKYKEQLEYYENLKKAIQELE